MGNVEQAWTAWPVVVFLGPAVVAVCWSAYSPAAAMTLLRARATTTSAGWTADFWASKPLEDRVVVVGASREGLWTLHGHA